MDTVLLKPSTVNLSWCNRSMTTTFTAASPATAAVVTVQVV